MCPLAKVSYVVINLREIRLLSTKCVLFDASGQMPPNLYAVLNGTGEVPPVASGRSGVAIVSYDATTMKLWYDVITDGMAGTPVLRLLSCLLLSCSR